LQLHRNSLKADQLVGVTVIYLSLVPAFSWGLLLLILLLGLLGLVSLMLMLLAWLVLLI
jgi:hypothetical protein